ncbi:hypothetical protein [Actinomadura xylanilytica]|uniref:hypothetical protein n=1 Tax=Actinomadura xylanilytica TaxID=887459 RepID=UPI00255AF5E1|nr:hypothetical protein [Actinomadura xylanilytica]MDL4773991.1 hypothetical protein [Actinomadura xylanilytica]
MSLLGRILQELLYGSPSEGAYGDGHRCVSLWPGDSMIVLDVVHDEIQFVEILHRDSLS